jgi:hypothetical protein
MFRATRMLLLCALLATPLAAQNYAPDWQFVDSRPNHPAALYILGQGLLKSYNLSRLLTKSASEEAERPQARFETLQRKQQIMDRAQTLGNFALASTALDWRHAIAQLKEDLQLCEGCSALPLLRRDLRLIYCRSGDLKNGLAESLEGQKLASQDADI